MFRGLFEGWHLVLVLLAVLLVFGANRLPGAARNLAQSLKIFKRELESGNDEPAGPPAAAAAPAATTPPPAPAPGAVPATGEAAATPPPAGPDAPPPAGGTAARA